VRLHRKPIDLEALCFDKGIDFKTAGDKHCRPGWIQINCPYCPGAGNFHLGYNLEKGYFNCWSCGWHAQEKVLGELLGLRGKQIWRLWHDYSLRRSKVPDSPSQPHLDHSSVQEEPTLPTGTTDLKPIHRKYLEKRLFDPDKLADIWGLKGTGFLGRYKFRIIAPIYFRGRLVSYQGRDITGKSGLKYKACNQKDELLDHNSTLYGYDLVPRHSVVVVEGITDCWRIGPGTVATFGKIFTQEQARLLKDFKNRFILFDSDAMERAEMVARTISVFKGHTEILILDHGDPAEMAQSDADEIYREFIL